MSIVRIDADNIERYALLSNPSVSYTSSSSGVTGSLPLFPDGSSKLKDIKKSSNDFNDSSVEPARLNLYSSVNSGKNSFGAGIEYLKIVNGSPFSQKFSKTQEVTRLVPPSTLNKDFQKKKTVKNVLFPYYRSYYNSLNWGYTNYNTLNFVTGGNLNTNAVMIYPAGTATYGLDYFPLAPSSSFTFDFYINPRYGQTRISEDFKAGTLLHMSSCYAISLVSGTSVGNDGKIDGFRLLLQLSQSSEILPSQCLISDSPTKNSVSAPGSLKNQDHLFVSDDNSLNLNNWHHVAIRWQSTINQGSGSFVIDGIERGSFNIRRDSCMQPSRSYGLSLPDADALFIGNYFEGANSTSSRIAGFFNEISRETEGFTQLESVGNYYSTPSDGQFRHPLNAEFHDLKIFKTYRSDDQILSSSLKGIPFNTSSFTTAGRDDLVFYVPPFFVRNSPRRQVLQTPTKNRPESTTTPFNTSLSFGVAGHDVNLPNFTMDFVRQSYPRLYNLTASTVFASGDTTNQIIYTEKAIRKRNITVLPNDNGKFEPNFQILLSGGFTEAAQGNPLERFVTDLGRTDLTQVSLNNYVQFQNLLDNVDGTTNNSFSNAFSLNSFLETIKSDQNAMSNLRYRIALETALDVSSNEVVFFDVSNMFYGDKIKPGSVTITDAAVTGSGGRVSINLKDDGLGNLYRADSLTEHAKWSSVGSILYEEGIIAIKAPTIPMFGADSFTLEFQGERYIHVFEINVPAPRSLVNSSTNPTFIPMVPTDYANESAETFVYITGVQLHDENLNVIGRATLAQPVVKRDSDNIVFRLRMDY